MRNLFGTPIAFFRDRPDAPGDDVRDHECTPDCGVYCCGCDELFCSLDDDFDLDEHFQCKECRESLNEQA